ncbi:MAG: hypothetical protein ACREJ2_11935 [Planctomycetota bacterium]
MTSPATEFIDCGRFAWVSLEQAPPHWITLPPPTASNGPGEFPVLDADPADSPSDSAAAPPFPSDSASVYLRERPLADFIAALLRRLNDPLTARPSARLTDHLSSGLSSRHTQLDDTPAPSPAWPLVTLASPDDLERLLGVHDAAWTDFERSGAALALRIEPPPDTPDVFAWWPVFDRFFERHSTLPVLLDAMGPTGMKGWDQIVRVGSDAQLYGLARGLPGLAPGRRGVALEELTAPELRRAEAILHFYVGEAGAQRVLFGSGQGRHVPLDETRIHALAQWFARERPWLEPASVPFLLHANAQRLAMRQIAR